MKEPLSLGIPFRLFWASASLALLSGLPGTAIAQKDKTLDPDLPLFLELTTAMTPDEVQKAYYDYIWKTFIALNWPNQDLVIDKKTGKIKPGLRGVPNPRVSILEQKGSNPDGMKYFSVWENYKEPGEVFLQPNDWANYPDWNTPRPQPPGTAKQARRLLQFSENFAEYATDINQPSFFPTPTGPLVDMNANFVRYEVAINEAFFTYVKHFRYYNANRQIAAVRYSVENPPPPPKPNMPPRPPLAPRPLPNFQRPPHGFFGDDPEYKKTFKDPKNYLPNETYLKGTTFPEHGLVDLKAAWRVLDPKKGDLPERYLHRKLVIDDDGNTQLMGLVALHILRFIYIKTTNPKTGEWKIGSGYVASTFEQEDNVSLDDEARKAGVKTPSFNDGSPPNATEAEYGFDFSVPPLAVKDNPAPQQPVNVYRVKSQTLSKPIVKCNDDYQGKLGGSVFAHYELIGTQNKTPDKILNFNAPPKDPPVPPDLDRNGHQGPITGVYTNTNNLVNSALESYTQKNFSCILCHAKAGPQGVPDKALEEDYFKTLTFLLKVAHARTEE